MIHLNTRRNASASAVQHVDGLGEKVVLDMVPDGIEPERFVATKEEAVAFAESLLRAAGVKFKITLNP